MAAAVSFLKPPKKPSPRIFSPTSSAPTSTPGSINDPVYSLPETASKLLNLGIELPDIVRQTTTAAAAAIGRSDHLGTLKIGTVADLSAFEIREGEFQFRDVRDNLEIGRKNIHPVLTIRAGKVYRPESLREERDETLARAREIRALTSRRFGDLGWTPPGA